jgi:uncharacterized secreted protein with C-terminal beta-propeller domain
MISKDFLMRQLETLTEVIAKILLKKDIGVKDEVRNEIGNGCKTLIGLDYNFINNLPVQQLVSFFSITGNLDVVKTLVTAKLFNLASDAEDIEEKTKLKIKASYLYDAILSNTNDDEYHDLKKEIEEEVEKLDKELDELEEQTKN